MNLRRGYSSLASVTIAVTDEDKIMTWGDARYCQTGIPRTDPEECRQLQMELTFDDNYTASDIKQLSLGSNHALALMKDGKVLRWGAPYYRDLGPVRRPELVRIGKPAAAIGCGQQVGGIITEMGELFIYGSNYYDELGFLSHPRCKWDPEKHPFQFPSPVVSLTGGSQFTIVRTKDGSFFGWGKNSKVELGFTDKNPLPKPEKLLHLDAYEIDSLSCGNEHVVATLKDGSALIWGTNGHGQLGLGEQQDTTPQKLSFSSPIVAVACGGFHTLILLEDNSLYVAGFNSNNELGLGDNESRRTWTKHPISDTQKIIGIAVGGNHSMIFNEKGELYNWGCNFLCQLGFPKETKARGHPTPRLCPEYKFKLPPLKTSL